MKKILPLILIIFALSFGGCGSLLRIQSSERQSIPAPPRESLGLKESKQRALQFSRDVLDRVYTTGVSEGNEIVKSARDLCGIVISTEGSPANPLEVPSNISKELENTQKEAEQLEEDIEELQEEANELKEEIKEYSTEHQEKEETFEKHLRKRRDEELGVEEYTEVKSDWLSWFFWILGTLGIGAPIVIGFLAIYFPASLGFIWSVFKKLAGMANDLFAGLQDVIEDDDIDEETTNKIIEKFERQMDKKTRKKFNKKIKKWKKKENPHEKIEP